MPVPPRPPDPETLLQHREFLRALARNLLADEHLAEDVVQESFVLALTRPPRAAESLRSWLARVVERRASNRRRGEARRRRREGESARGEAVPSAAEVSESLVLQRRVLAALDALHEPYKTAIFMRWYEGLPPREIARRQGVPVETVRSRIKRGLAKLRSELDAEFGDREAWAVVLWPLTRPEKSLLLSSGALLTAAAGGVAVLALVLANRSGAPLPGGERPEEPERIALEAGASSTAADPGPGAPDPGPADERSGRRSIEAPAGRVEGSAAEDASGGSARSPTESPPGPTFELELDLPPGLEPEGLRAELSWIDDGDRERRSGPVPVRPGSPPWVAFVEPPPISLTTRGARSTYRLRVTSRDGRWGASARVHSVRGRYPVPVPLRLEGRGTLELRLHDERGAPVAEARVRVRRAAGGEPPRRTRTDGAGRCRFAALEPGSWSVAVDSVHHEPRSRELEVVAGVALEEELALLARSRMRVRGRVWSRSGAALDPAPLRLRTAETPAHVFHALPEVDPERPGTWRFDFGEVPQREYVLLPPEGSPCAWDPPLRRLDGGELAADFERLDGGETRRVRFRVFDRETGEPLERFETTLLVDRYGLGAQRCAELERPLHPRATRFDETPWEAAAEDLPVHWLVECEGYQALQGDDSALVRRGEDWLLELRLAPAWRATFWTGAIAGDGRRVPLAGARLLTHAGRELGRSLEDGFLRIDLTYDPGVLAFELDGWGLVEWTGFDDGRREEELEVHEVWFEPRD